MIARKALREMFQKAGMGLSGANFIVADTGTAVSYTHLTLPTICSV